MPVTISLEVFGEAAISRELLRFSERALDAAPAFEEISKMFYDSETKQFDTEGAWASGGWTPLKPATVAAKARKNLRTNILQRTGALYESLTSDGSDFGHKIIGPSFMEITSSVPYGKYHQQADGPGKGIIPMRKPVELPEGVKVDMVKALQAWIVGGVKFGNAVTV